MLALVIAALMGAAVQSAPLPPPCPTEDSVGCYWDAQSRGNGEGRSFVVDDRGRMTYLPPEGRPSAWMWW